MRHLLHGDYTCGKNAFAERMFLLGARNRTQGFIHPGEEYEPHAI